MRRLFLTNYIFELVRKGLRNGTKLLVNTLWDSDHMQCFRANKMADRSTRNTNTINSVDERCFHSHIGPGGIHI